MGKTADTKDLILLLLYARGQAGNRREPIRGRTRLVKMIFLFKKEIAKHFRKSSPISETTLPNFEAHNFGPFSPQVYQDLEFLVDNGFVSARAVGESPSEPEAEEYEYWQMTSGADDQDTSFSEEEFSLTDLGASFVADGEAGQVSDEQWETLHKFKARCTGVSLKQLLRYVYTKYPETTTKSKILNDIL